MVGTFCYKDLAKTSQNQLEARVEEGLSSERGQGFANLNKYASSM